MSFGFRIFFLIAWLYCIFLCALMLFTKGFLLKRIVINNSSECERDNWTINNLWNGLTTNFYLKSEASTDNSKCHRELRPKFQKAILMIIDGLRYDFLQYNSSLIHPLPYQNKMKKLHDLLREQPTNGKLFKFEADPPTTTMQRIKGITTGSLPTFIDAGSNFNSYEITEDNILSHALRQQKNITFMGCSTWTELFPNHFHRKIPFSALNVKDLDTIDYGIMKHLIPEVKRSDWSMMIVHFLGVDHCGHRYGTQHHEMTRKLTEMDNVISGLTEAVDNDTVVFVMGDHGMTISGDHGGDSDDEVMAGLFTYSKRGLFTPTETKIMPQVSQIDLVPTLSLLLDQPIPFSNLGSVIPDFYGGFPKLFLPNFIKSSEINETLKALSSRLFKHINLAYSSFLNCKQLLSYINEYEMVSGDLPADKLIAAKSTFEFVEMKFEDCLNSLIAIDWINNADVSINEVEEAIVELEYLQRSFQDFLLNIKLICRSIWAKFDLFSISMGLTLMIFTAAVCFIAPFSIHMETLQMQGRVSCALVSTVGFAFCIVGMIYVAIPFEDVIMSSFVVFIAASFSLSLWLLSSNVSIAINKQTVYRISVLIVVPLCFFVSLFSLFSNSYIIHEDTVTLYFCQSFILFYLCYYYMNQYKEHRMNSQFKGGYVHNRTKVVQFLISSSSLQTFICCTTALVCLRWTKLFWFCREMQLKCSLSTYALPLAFLLSEFNESYGTERILLAVFSFVVIATSVYWYIKKNGSLMGSSLSIVVVKHFSVLSVALISIHWIFQLILRHPLAVVYNLGYVQQIVIPRVVYVIFIGSVIVFSTNPLFIRIIFRSKNGISQKSDLSEIPNIYNELKNKLSNSREDLKKPPLVYGLQAVYSSSFISLIFMMLILACLILADGMTYPVLMLLMAGYCLLNLIAGHFSYDCTYGTVVVVTFVWNLFASFGFYATSHQTTLPSIKYQAAYIGFKGSIPEIIPQVIVLVFNTFASQIICSLALPLIMIFAHRKKHGKEVDMVETPDTSRFCLLQTMMASISFHVLRVVFTASSAALHRRHLMVWKIFAPRFLFEVVSFIIIIPVMLLGYLYFIRIDNALRKCLKNLEEYLGLDEK